MFNAITAEENEEAGTNHALIIGIGDYDDWRDLKASRKGANELKKVLEEQYNFLPENIVLLTDESEKKPTLKTIKKTMKEMIFDLRKTDNLLIYYSGHSRQDDVTRDVYWIPQDGDKKKKSTWLELQYVSQILASDLFEARNVCILTESHFARRLLNVEYLSIGRNDLRYQDRIREKALKRSREVIAFGDSEPYVTQKSRGMGVFTHYLIKALEENKLKYIDFESMLYDETILTSIKRTAGTNYVLGRFKRSPDKGGQFVIERTVASVPVNVTQASVSPAKGYEGDEFEFIATTNADAEEVYLEVDGNKYYMQGSGTEWSFSQKVDARGSINFKVVAMNEEGREGSVGEGQLQTQKRPAKLIAMVATGVEPEKSFAGEEFEFTARTEKPAEGAVLMIGEKRYEMKGSGKSWALKMEIDEIGMLEYTVAALNEDGEAGSQKRGFFVTRPQLVHILAATASSETGFAGDEFVFKAETDSPADVVYVEMDGIAYEMEGFGTEWEYRKKLSDIGKKTFIVIANNSEGAKGAPREGSIIVAAPMTNIAKLAVSPSEGYGGDDFIFRAETTSPAKKVYIEIDGKRFAMEGSGTDWSYKKKIDAIGATKYAVVARNEEGKDGKYGEGQLLTTKRPADLIAMSTAKVKPEKSFAGEEYEFSARTDKAAEGVILIIDEKRYEMKGSGKDWSLKVKIEDIGTIEYAMTALNEDSVEGSRKIGLFVTRPHLVKVLEVAATSETGFTGDEFVFKAKTDRPANVVFVEMEGITYEMEGSGTEWEYRRKLSEIGQKKFIVVANNSEGAKGHPKEGSFEVAALKANIAKLTVSPSKGYEGDDFMFRVQTTAAAKNVYIEIEGKRFAMEGSGTEWNYMKKVDVIGATNYTVMASNEDGKEGGQKEGEVFTTKRPAKLVGVAMAKIEPDSGYAGEEYEFSAKTDKSAKGVMLIIGGKRYEMEGSGKDWSLKKQIEDVGSVEYAMAALNEDSVEGSQKIGLFVTKAPLVKVLEVAAASKTGFAGEEFIFTARTDRPADIVFVEMEGITYEMTGSGTQWEYRKKLSDIGEKKFIVVANNSDGAKGHPKEGSLVVAALMADISKLTVSPSKGYEGDEFMFRVQTTAAAKNVYIEIDGQRVAMEGSGTDWNYTKKVEVIGTTKYTVLARNEDGKDGGLKEGEVFTTKRPAKLVDVVMAKIEPETGYAGDEYKFTAKTAKPAKSAVLIIDGKRFPMKGSGMDWGLQGPIENIGTVEYAVVAVNEDGVEGSQKGGFFTTKAQIVKVLEVSATSETGYAGDEFVFKAKTDRPADTVFVEMEGITYQMTGSGMQWEYRKKLSTIGEQKFSVIAKNIEGAKGLPGKGTFMVAKVPARLADIAKLDSAPAEGMDGYAGDDFVFSAETTAVATEVYIEMDGQRFAMEGSGTDWSFTRKMDDIGFTPYKVTAVNEEGNKGRLMEARIEVQKKSAGPIILTAVEVEPRKGFVGGEYSFKAKTGRSAKGVTLIIGKDRYKMEGSGRDWSFKTKINTPGTTEFAMIALNQDDLEGDAKKNTFFVNEGRFVDNGDGTITDLETQMMWVQNGNVSWRSLIWEEAVEYTRSYDLNDYTDWRLPTKEEWEQLVDKSQKNPALPKGHPFENIVTADSYWSKTTHSFGPGYVWQVNLWNGKINYMNKKKLARVWPVRYSGFDDVSAKLSKR